jgi:hypothetical protein
VFKRFAQILALTVPLMLVACNNGTTTTTAASGGTTTTTSASYSGTYTGSSNGVNAGPTTMVIAADKSIKGTFTINNRTNDNGVPTIYEATLEGTVDSAGKVNVNSFLEGALVMIFTGSIDANGLLSGNYIEAAHPNDPSKHGTFSLQGPKNGSTTTTTTTNGKGCTGSYVGSVDQPSQEVRRSSRDTWLSLHGYNPAAMTEADKNAATGGGGVDGGIYMEGSFAFETDANCNVIKGQAILYGSPFDITGTVKADRTFALSYLGPIVGQINSDNSITGQLQHGGGEEYIHGVLRGTFTPNGKI